MPLSNETKSKIIAMIQEDMREELDAQRAKSERLSGLRSQADEAMFYIKIPYIKNPYIKLPYVKLW